MKLFAALALTAFLTFGSPLLKPISADIIPVPDCYPCDNGDDTPLPDPPAPPGLPPCYPNCLVDK